MNLETAREFLLSLPHVTETLQWGDNLVFWVGDKAVGGKMFALADLDGRSNLVLALAAGHERAAELCEREGFRPAPYFARIGWVGVERWEVLPTAGWRELLTAAHGRVMSTLPRKTRDALLLPPAELERLILAGRARRASAKQAGGRQKRRG